MALIIGGSPRGRPGGRPPSTPLDPVEQLFVNRLVTTMNTTASQMDISAFANAIENLDPDLLERLLAEINVNRLRDLIEESLQRVVMSGATAEARNIIRNTPRISQNPFTALEYGGRVLESGIMVPTSLFPPTPDLEFAIEAPATQMFNYINQKSADYARTRSAQLVTSINESNRLAIRQVISTAFTGPRTTDQTARALRDIVGLHPRWARAVENFRENNMQRFIRDGMTVDNATFLVDEMAGKYRKKLIRRRSEMIARTEIQQAQNFGRQASWQASDRAGLLDARSEKEWRTAPKNSRYGPPCDECSRLQGQRVPWNGSFANGYSMPPAHPHCRCTAVLVPPTRGLTGLPSQDMGLWLDRLDALEAELANA